MTPHEAHEFLKATGVTLNACNPDDTFTKMYCKAISIISKRIQELENENGKLKIDSLYTKDENQDKS